MRPTFSRPSLAGLAAPIRILFLGLAASLLLSIASSGTFAATPAAQPAATLPEIQRMMKQGQLPQALQTVDAYVVAKPGDAPGRFLKGVILTEMRRPADAVSVFKQLTEDYPELPEPYNNLAVLYAQQKQYDKARIALEMAIRTHPSYSTAHENLGDIYAKLASQSYDRALQRDSTNTVTQSSLSLIRELGNNVAKPKLSASPTPAKPASAPTKTASVEPVLRANEIRSSSTVTNNPQAPESSVDDLEVSRMFKHWASAWSRQNFGSAIGYTISDLVCRVMREKINSPSRIAGSNDATGSIGCRSEPRKSRFW